MKRPLQSVLVAFLTLASLSLAHAQQSLNYGFVSPNTREDLKLDDAIQGMNSAEEYALLKRAKNLGCVVKRKIATMRALGSWSDGAEPSILLRANTDESTIRYLMSRLGKDANQKAVLYFHPSPNGNATIYAISPTRRLSFAFITRILDATGIAFRTLVPTRRTNVIYVVDTENNLRDKIKNVVKRLRAKLLAQKGIASFIGDDSDRKKGQAVFTQEMSTYESRHPKLPPPCVSN